MASGGRSEPRPLVRRLHLTETDARSLRFRAGLLSSIEPGELCVRAAPTANSIRWIAYQNPIDRRADPRDV